MSSPARRQQGDAAPPRMVMRVYCVDRAGAVHSERPVVCTDGEIDPQVAANPVEYPTCRCPRHGKPTA